MTYKETTVKRQEPRVQRESYWKEPNYILYQPESSTGRRETLVPVLLSPVLFMIKSSYYPNPSVAL